MNWWNTLSNGNKSWLIVAAAVIIIVALCVFCCLSGSLVSILPSLAPTP